jgi:serine/threonine protein kinase
LKIPNNSSALQPLTLTWGSDDYKSETTNLENKYRIFASLTAEILRGLDFLHHQINIPPPQPGWYNDLKPKNILIGNDLENILLDGLFQISDVGINRFQIPVIESMIRIQNAWQRLKRAPIPPGTEKCFSLIEQQFFKIEAAFDHGAMLDQDREYLIHCYMKLRQMVRYMRPNIDWS